MPAATRTEILVVGAGPAGATVARLLARVGREVLLIERASLPRHKPCGGGLPARTLGILGLDLDPLPKTRVDSVALAGAWTGTQVYDLRTDPLAPGGISTCRVVERAEFDAFLTRAAQAAGAVLRERCALRRVRRTPDGLVADTSAGAIQAQILCACDGVFSPTARACGFPPNALAFCIEGEVPMRADLDAATRTRATFHLACLRAGYAWSFPRGDCFAVGIGGALRRAPHLPQALARVAHSLPALRGEPLRAVRGGMLPDFREPRASYAHAGAFLLGDAAGLVDPLTGEGIYYALRSAIYAAHAIAEGGGESAYEATLRRDLLPELLRARAYAQRFRATPCWLRGLLMSLPRFRRYALRFVDLLSGRSSYRDL